MPPPRPNVHLHIRTSYPNPIQSPRSSSATPKLIFTNTISCISITLGQNCASIFLRALFTWLAIYPNTQSPITVVFSYTYLAPAAAVVVSSFLILLLLCSYVHGYVCMYVCMYVLKTPCNRPPPPLSAGGLERRSFLLGGVPFSARSLWASLDLIAVLRMRI
jgi:hypothetical protein